MPLADIHHPDYFEHIQRLLETPDEEYVAPESVPFDDDLDLFHRSPHIPLGHATKLALFTLDPSISLLNHGSYGACPKPVQAVRQAHLELQEFEPVQNMINLGPRLVRVLRVIAAYLGVPPTHVNLLPNASTGTSCVLRSLSLNKDSVLMSFNLGYPAVMRQLNHVCTSTGARQAVVHVNAPFSHVSILAAFDAVLNVTPYVTIVVVDHITSATGLIMPLEVHTRIFYRTHFIHLLGVILIRI
jgi:hypothetical protein